MVHEEHLVGKEGGMDKGVEQQKEPVRVEVSVEEL